jgi:hypothetical protein
MCYDYRHMKTYLIVLAAIAVGLVPGVLSYEYVMTHADILTLVGTDTLVTAESQSAAVALARTSPRSAEYISSPVAASKTDCAHSSHESFFIGHISGASRLVALCEDARDRIVVRDIVSIGTGDDAANTDTYIIASADGTRQPAVFSREPFGLRVASSSIAALMPGTMFYRLPITVPTDGLRVVSASSSPAEDLPR